MNGKFKAFIQQPTTVIGLASLAATGVGALVFVSTHNAAGAVGAFTTTFGLACAGLKDNSAVQSSLEQEFSDAITVATQGHMQTMLPKLVRDTMALIKSLRDVAAAPGATVATVVAAPSAPTTLIVTPEQAAPATPPVPPTPAPGPSVNA